MSVQHANRGIVKKDLQLYYNREFVKSFRGESTTNIVSNTTDFSGLSYAGYESEWTSDPTRFTKSYNSTLQTPIGTGATLLTESGTAGYYHLSRFGGSGAGNHSISCYVYSVNGSITNFAIGMLGDGGSTAIFNLVTGTVVSTGVRVSNAFITKVSGWSGWYRVGANIGGRSGGWVGAVGLDVQTSYTPSSPYKSMYVTGMQYESKAYCTPFVVGSNRSANTVAGGGGLLDISGNNVNADLTNVLFNSSGYYFNGSSNSIYLGTELNLQNGTICAWVNPAISTTTTYRGIVTKTSGGGGGQQSWYIDWYSGNALRGGIGDSSGAEVVTQTWNPTISTWYFITFVFDSSYLYLYMNGVLFVTPVARTKICQNTAHPVYIGRAFEEVSYAWNGQIGQVTVNRTALTAAEVLQNFNATRKTYGI